MARLAAVPRLDFRATLEISEAEARFLDALVGYGAQELIAAVKKHLGTSYIERHDEAGVQFCESLRESLPAILKNFDDARAVFHHTPKGVLAGGGAPNAGGRDG